MVELKIVESNSQQNICNKIIKQNHSYVPTTSSVGRRIDYLIYNDNKLCGMIGIGSATYPPCKDILKYIGLSKNEYKNMFNSFANNWRFCLTVKIKNLGTKVLKLFREQVAKDWYIKYGDELEYIFTFVGANHNGSVYLADNWVKVGYTSGLPSHKSVSMKWDSSKQISKKFVKPNGEDRKIILVKKLKRIDKNITKRPQKENLF